MAELLGLGTTDQPYMRVSDEMLSSPLKTALKSERIPAELKDRASWPAPMRAEWGSDEGGAAGRAARIRQVEQFRRVGGALEEFRPDFVIIWCKDARESLKDYAVPPYWIQAHHQVEYKPYTSLGCKENVFDEDPDKVVTVRGHPAGAKHLVKGLAEAGFDPTYSLQPLHQNGLAHTFAGVVVHLDWDRRALQDADRAHAGRSVRAAAARRRRMLAPSVG